MTENQRPKPWLETTTLSAGVVIVLVLFAMANYLSMRHYKRFDATGSKLYSLSEKTEKVLEGLDRDVDLVVVINPASGLYTAVDELLDRYVAVNPDRLERRDLDAARDRREMEQLISDYGIQRDNVIIVAAGNDQRVISEFELATYDYSGAQYGQPPAIDEFKGEQLITSAIYSLIETEKPKALFTTGHGEARLDPADARALTQVEDLLRKDNFEIEEWSSFGADSVPAGTDVLVIAGPTTNFLEPELELFSAYLEAGGRLLIFLDPVFSSDGVSFIDLGLGEWLRGYGVETRDDLVIDPTLQHPLYGAETFYTDQYGAHPIVERLERTQTRIFLPLVRSVTTADIVPPHVEVTELVLTSADGWAETDMVSEALVPDAGADLLGPVSIAVAATIGPATGDTTGGDIAGEDTAAEDTAAEDTATEEALAAAPTTSPRPDSQGRLVVFGDLDFTTDAWLATGANNVILLNTFNWLAEREQLIEIEARKPEKTRLNMAGGELVSLYLIVLLLMPGAAVVAGVWIAMQRRR